jgi:iron(III) transport system ATP-binding protein
VSAIVAKGLEFRHGETPVLSGVDLELAPGARLAVLGPSGAGKTTLLRLLAGLEIPSAGRLELGGALASEAGQLHLPPERREVGFVFQDLALWPHLDVAGTLRFAGGSSDRVQELADQVGLGQRLDAFPDQLSGGEQQRLALARALASEPKLLLLDEPFAHLDRSLRDDLQGQLLELCAARPELTLISVTHQVEAALTLGQELLLLREGRVLEQGLAAEVVACPKTSGAVELLGLGRALPFAKGECAFGPVELAEESPEDASAVLIRPDQLELDPKGVQCRVIAMRLLPNTRSRVELSLGEYRLSADLAQAPTEKEVGVRLRGPCWGLRG